MFHAFIGLILVSLLAVLFLASYCRSLLAQASEAKLSAAAQKAIATESGTISAEDFQRLHALARLCPFGQKDEVSLRAISVYYLSLQGLHGISSRMSDAFAGWAKRERQRCSYFVAVCIDRRIAAARKLWAEQMIRPEK